MQLNHAEQWADEPRARQPSPPRENTAQEWLPSLSGAESSPKYNLSPMMTEQMPDQSD